MPRICRKCGEENKYNTNFCSNCGEYFSRPKRRKEQRYYNNIFEAIRNKDLSAAIEFVKNDELVVNSRDSSGLTPLHLAAEMGLKELAEFLIKKGAAINTRSPDGWTPLDLAMVEAHGETERLIRRFLISRSVGKKSRKRQELQKRV